MQASFEVELVQDPRVGSTTSAEDCWYSNGEDGPGWVRLIVRCSRPDRDELMAPASELSAGLDVRYY